MRTPRRAATHLALGLVALTALLAACGDDADDPGAGGGGEPPTADEIPWGTELLSTEVVIDGDPDGLVEGTRIALVFHDDGRATAAAGCNTIGIDAPQVVDGRLQATAGSMTEMGCDPELHAQDEWLAAFLTSAPTWDWDGTTLVLTTDDAEVTLVDRETAEPDVALEGTRWVLDSVIEGSEPDGAVSSVPEGVEAHLLFDDGTVTGSTGCNQLTGEAAVEGDRIVFGPIATTLMICEDPLGAVESPMLAVLDGTVRWTVDGDRLTLGHASGEGLGFTAADG